MHEFLDIHASAACNQVAGRSHRSGGPARASAPTRESEIGRPLLLPRMQLSDSDSMRSPNRCHERNRFYKYMTASTAKIVLVDRQLPWSSPVPFNDPLDVPRRFDPGYDEDHLCEAVVKVIESGGFSAVKPSAKVQAILRLPGLSTNYELRKQLAGEFRKNYASGLLSRDNLGISKTFVGCGKNTS